MVITKRHKSRHLLSGIIFSIPFIFYFTAKVYGKKIEDEWLWWVYIVYQLVCWFIWNFKISLQYAPPNETHQSKIITPEIITPERFKLIRYCSSEGDYDRVGIQKGIHLCIGLKDEILGCYLEIQGHYVRFEFWSCRPEESLNQNNKS